MSYDQKLKAFQKFGGPAADRLVASNPELFLSISEKDVFEQIAAITRIRANEIPTPTNEIDMFTVLAQILGELLAAGKITIASYGLSALGIEERAKLIELAEVSETAA